MSVFDKYLVNKPLHAETDSGAIPTAFYSEDFAVSLGAFTTSGDALWTRVINEGNGDLFSAMSGNIADKQASILELVKVTTQESTYLKFDYKTSTEGGYDYLMVIVNDVIVKRYSGTNAWTTDSVFIHGIGSQTIKFVYWKDNSSDGGSLDTVWIDNVSLHNYEESGISNTSTLFKEDLTVYGNLVQKNGEASFAEINLTGRLNAFNEANKRFLAIRPAGTGGNISMWNDAGVFGYTISMSDTNSGVTLNNPTTGATAVVMGANDGSLSGGFLQLPQTNSYLRLGEYAGADLTKILVVNGESIFRGKVDIDDGTGVSGTTNYISFATDRGWIGYDAGNLKIQASSGKGIRWSTDTLTFATAGEDMYLYQGRLGVGDYATAQQAQLTVTDYTAGTNNVAFFKGQAITEGDATTISINNGYSAEYSKEVKIGAVSESSNSNLTGMALYTSPNDAGSVERVRIDSDGNVGIGTTLPESRLHIYELGVDSPTTLILENGDIGINNTEDVHKIEFQSNDASANGVGVAASIRVNAENAGNIYALAFNTQNVADRGERMRIDGAGNVGIGTTSPNYKLEVFGTGNLTNI